VIEKWIEHGKVGMEYTLRAKQGDVREQYEREIEILQVVCGKAMLKLRTRNYAVVVEQERAMMQCLLKEPKRDGFTVLVSKLCPWFNVQSLAFTTNRARLGLNLTLRSSSP
jgi:hypothetical protein